MYVVNTALVDETIRNLPAFTRNQILDALDDIKQDPYHARNARLMSGGYSGYYRCKVGDYRIMYDIQERRVTVLIMKIDRRDRVYRD